MLQIFRALVGGDSTKFSLTSLASENEIPGLSCGVVCVTVYLAVLTEHLLVTDEQTDRQGYSIIPRIGSRGTKIKVYLHATNRYH